MEHRSQLKFPTPLWQCRFLSALCQRRHGIHPGLDSLQGWWKTESCSCWGQNLPCWVNRLHRAEIVKIGLYCTDAAEERQMRSNKMPHRKYNILYAIKKVGGVNLVIVNTTKRYAYEKLSLWFFINTHSCILYLHGTNFMNGKKQSRKIFLTYNTWILPDTW